MNIELSQNVKKILCIILRMKYSLSHHSEGKCLLNKKINMFYTNLNSGMLVFHNGFFIAMTSRLLFKSIAQ